MSVEMKASEQVLRAGIKGVLTRKLRTKLSNAESPEEEHELVEQIVRTDKEVAMKHLYSANSNENDIHDYLIS
jgi:hypothetical protein